MSLTPRIVSVVLAVSVLGLMGALAYALLSGPSVQAPGRDVGTADAGLPADDDPYFLLEKIAFRPVAVDAAALDAARARRPSQPLPPDADLAPVKRALAQLGRAERTGATDEEQRAAQQRFTVHLTQFYASFGAASIQALEAALWEAFRDALESVRDAARTLERPLADLAAGTGGELDGSLDTLGSFAILGGQIGLLGEDGAVKDEDWPIVRLAFRVRLFASLGGALSPDELLASEEVRTFYLWRLHNAPVTDVKLRRRWAERMRLRVPDYPSAIADAVVLHQDGQSEPAREALQIARELHPERAALLDHWAALP